MPCTNEKPCLNPILRWVHSDKCYVITLVKKLKKEPEKCRACNGTGAIDWPNGPACPCQEEEEEP